MVKYSSSLKAKIVGEYLQGNISAKGIAEKYYLPRRQVAHWIQRYRLSGVDSLKRRNVKREFSAEFKLDVIDYYQTHDESQSEVAAKFDLIPCQISIWRTTFNREGILGLKPRPKGRPTKMKRNNKQLRQLVNKSEVERLREELAEKNKELYDTKLERDILKKSVTLFGPSKGNEKHK